MRHVIQCDLFARLKKWTELHIAMPPDTRKKKEREKGKKKGKKKMM